MFEENSLVELDASCVHRPYLVASVVLRGVPEVITCLCVLAPRFSLVWCYVEFDCIPKWCPRIMVVVMFTVYCLVGRHTGVYP